MEVRRMLAERSYETEFHAAHLIIDHPHCGRLHGHTYKLKVYVQFDTKIWFDFNDLKHYVDEVLVNYDHTVLGCSYYKQEDVLPIQDPKHVHITLEVMTMTAEMIAQKIKAELTPSLFYKLGGDFILKVELKETSSFGVKV